MIRRVLFLVPTAAVLLACGPTKQEVADSYRDGVLAKKADIVAAAKLVDAQHEASLPSCEDTRIPLVHSAYGGPSDTAFAMLEWLLHLDDPDHDVPFKLTDAFRLQEALQWSSEDNPWFDRDERAEDDFAAKFEHVLGLRYLALSRAQNYQEPRVVSAESFLPGSVEITTWIVAIDPPKVLCRAEFTATTAEEVTASSFAKFPDLMSAQFAVRRSLYDAARKEMNRVLREVSETPGP
ncbi:MAG: hypothetical protein ACQGVK_15055 [Myxococcota bacterium]